MREEVLASAEAQDMLTRCYELLDLEDIDIFWENPQAQLDAVFRPGLDIPFSPIVSTIWRWAEYHPKTLLCWMERTRTTPLFERPTETPRLLRSRPFGRRNESVSEFVMALTVNKFIVCVRVILFTIK